jgi:hypothetical protein
MADGLGDSSGAPADAIGDSPATGPSVVGKGISAEPNTSVSEGTDDIGSGVGVEPDSVVETGEAQEAKPEVQPLEQKLSSKPVFPPKTEEIPQFPETSKEDSAAQTGVIENTSAVEQDFSTRVHEATKLYRNGLREGTEPFKTVKDLIKIKK